MKLDDVTDGVGKGLLAGLIGTAVMTLSSTLEAKARGRGGSSAPAEAAGKVLGVEPRDEQGEARFAGIAHWGYGTSWGAVRGLIGAAGLEGPTAAAVHFACVWGGAQALLPALHIAPPPWRTEAKELGVDIFHHGVYAAATSVAYTALDR